MQTKDKKPKKEKDPYLSEDYLNYHNTYAKIYGQEHTIVFMQVGGFYEAYSIIDDGPDLIQLSKLTGVIKTKKNKGISEVSLRNPNFLGFPINAITKYTEILLGNDYVVIIVDQVPNKNENKDKKKEERKVTHIYSRGTYIENIEKKDGNYIVCVYLTNENSLLSAGMTGIDVSTGHVHIHESCSIKHDESIALDEIDRFISTLCPNEILIYFDSNEKPKSKKIIGDVVKMYNKDYILNYLKLNESGCRFYENVNNKYTNCTFQNEILKLVYVDANSLISPIEKLDLEKNIYTNTALCLAFDFIHDKNSMLVSNLMIPEWFSTCKKLILGNNALRQLDIMEDLNHTNKCKFRSLFHVVNNTSTAVGERFLKQRLLAPRVDSTELNLTYSQIDNLIIDEKFKMIESHLDNIRDIERLQRKLELQIIKPFELVTLLGSYDNIVNLIISIKDTKNQILIGLLPHSNTVSKIDQFIKHIEHTFNVNELEKYSKYDFKEISIFNNGIHIDIDNITESVCSAHSQIEELRDHLDGLIKTTNKKCVHIKKNDRDGYYLCMTNLKAITLKEKMNKLKILNVSKMKIKVADLEIKEVGKITKIFMPSLGQNSDEIVDYDEKFTELNKFYFLEELSNIYKLFCTTFRECSSFIAKIDFIKSCAKTATIYGYVRPVIVSSNKKNKTTTGFISVTKLRHPIIERLIDYEYVPHDITLGKDLKGMLLYGTNSSGKSSMMKAIGLSIVMAQAGMFVPAESMTYCPYTSLYTRITGDDNIFRGLSSFTLEMVEINAILKRSSKNTLVIGDEVCRGTEHISGNAIVASTIIKLAESGSTFIFATHLHEIMQINRIKELAGVKAYHLGITYNEKTKLLVYDRTLKEGSGNQLYGITVAQYIIQDKSFIDMAIEIKNDLLGTYDSMLGSGKVASYNKNVMVYECKVCKRQDKKDYIAFLEVHHINHQKDCDGDFVKDKKHIKKNQEANLVPVCYKCHDKIHAGEIFLQGYVMTSEGKNLIIS